MVNLDITLQDRRNAQTTNLLSKRKRNLCRWQARTSHMTNSIRFIVRPQYQEEALRQRVIQLSSQLRKSLSDRKVFVNGYILDHASQAIPNYLYAKEFWYSVCQLVQGGVITNSNPLMLADSVNEWAQFIRRHPSAVHPSNRFQGVF
jgi:hypothetical protein